MTDVLVDYILAEGSKIKGCEIVLTRFSDNKTESITSLMSHDQCHNLTQTRSV